MLNHDLPWDVWLMYFFPEYYRAPFARHHQDFWSWIEEIQPDARPRPFAGFWPRAGGSSVSGEGGAIRVAAKGMRRHILYVTARQKTADTHLESMGAMLAHGHFYRHNQHLKECKLWKEGDAKTWQRLRLQISEGVIIQSLGLDRMHIVRHGFYDGPPDMIVIEDIDEIHDYSDRAAIDKITALKQLIAMGADNCAIVFLQGIKFPGSVASRIAHLTTDVLVGGIIGNPVPAIFGLDVKDFPDGRKNIITKGFPSWAGQDVVVCQALIDAWGYPAFKQFAQHDF